MVTSSNTSALNSPIYNPSYDDTDLSIYNIISNNMSSDTYNTLLKQYTNTWYNLSTVNQYEGALMNPTECDSLELGNDISSIISQLSSLPETDSYYDQISNPNISSSLVSMLSGGTPTTSTLSSDDILNYNIENGGTLTPNNDGSYSLTSYTNNNAIQPGLNNTSSHLDRLIANLPMMLALAQSAMGIATAIGNLLNPCINLGNFFSSLNGFASSIIAKIKQIIAKIQKYVQAGLDAVKSALSEIQDLMNQAISYITSLVSQIATEIKNFIKSLIDSIKINLSGFLKGLKLDPCAKSMVKSVTTAAARFTL